MLSARRTLAMAGLVCSAVPGAQPTAARRAPSSHADIEAVEVHDSQGRVWLVRAPRTPSAGMTLDAEAQFTQLAAAVLPIAVPAVTGWARLGSGGRAAVGPAVEGAALAPARLEASAILAASMGRTIAAIHALSPNLIANAGLATYTSEEHRARRLVELDRAASTGHVPAELLTRWENELQATGLWQFVPSVVHGELDDQNVLVRANEVCAVLDWSQARVGDPADDFAWLANATSESTFTLVLSAYRAKALLPDDEHFVRRARLSGEMALARWLLHGTTTGQDDVVKDAVEMLNQLAEDVATPTPNELRAEPAAQVEKSDQGA